MCLYYSTLLRKLYMAEIRAQYPTDPLLSNLQFSPIISCLGHMHPDSSYLLSSSLEEGTPYSYVAIAWFQNLSENLYLLL